VLKRLIKRVQQAAETHVPEGLKQTGQRLAGEVLDRAPDSLKSAINTIEHTVEQTVDALDRWLDEPEQPEAEAEPSAPPSPAQVSVDELATEVAVVVFGYPEDPDLTEVEALLEREGVEYRAMNLHQQRRAADQIAAITGVMQSPYVYIHGRFWGGLGEVQSLIGLGELATVVDNEIDGLSQEARRIGKIREVFDDTLTRENITARLQQGHILAIDGVDCWYEKGITAASARIYYDGRPRSGDALSEVADEIVARAAADSELEIKWLFEPEVDLDA